VGQAVVEPAVVGQQQQPGGVLVEPSHRKHPRGNVDQLEDDPLARVVAAGHIAPGFVQGNVNHPMFRSDQNAVHRDPILLRVDLGAERVDHLTVHLDASGADKRFPTATRAHAGRG